MRCVADSLDLDADGEPVHYCRLPRRDASECERARDYLRPVGQYVELLRRTKDDPTRAERMTGPPCEEDADCEDGRICSRRAGRCIEDKVVVAAIVGPDAEGDPARPSCTGATGQAFDGRRYAGLVDASSAQGVRESICGDQADFRRALEEIGEMVVDAVEPSLCLPHPLVPCRSDADCGEGYACHGLSTAAERRGAGWSPTPYCADADGLPETLRVLIAEARQEGEEEGAPWPRTLREPAYTFVPGDGPHGFGCFRFISDGPGPGEQVRLSYRPKLVSE